jgi:hypothetical protein
MPSKADLFCVPPEDIGQAWPLARNLIFAAIKRTGLSEFDDIEKQVLSGEQLLWLAISDHVEAAATTHLVKPGPVCVLTACGGHERERWLPLFKQIEQYAKNEGAKCMRIYGRRGWERVLDGYRVEHVILEKAMN